MLTAAELLALPEDELGRKIAEAEREVIGHALALTHWLDYIGPRPQGRFWNKLYKATDELRAAALAGKE